MKDLSSPPTPAGILTLAFIHNLRALLKIVCGGSREICEITKEEEKEENSDVNDGCMWRNNRNIRTETYLDEASEPGVVGSG